MLKIYHFAILLFLAEYSYCQDTLYKTNGTVHLVKILEVNKTCIKYTQFSYLNGPVHVICLEDIIKIKYPDGRSETFAKANSKGTIHKWREDPRKADFGKNFIALNVTDLHFGSLTLSYERLSMNGLYSLRCPISLGLIPHGLDRGPHGDLDINPKLGYYNRNKYYSTGLDFYFYPFGQGRLKFFFGPSIEYGQSRYLSYSAILAQNGFLFQPLKNINISITAGAGAYSYWAHHDIRGGGWTGEAGINIGFKF
jgi:hypothetical protein